jgi:hypothetical protein
MTNIRRSEAKDKRANLVGRVGACHGFAVDAILSYF